MISAVFALKNASTSSIPFAFTDAIEEALAELDRNAGIGSTVTMLAAKLRNAQKER